MLHVFDYQLKLAAALVEGHPAAQAHRQAAGGFQAHALVAVAEHRTAHLRRAVLEGEVPVAGGGRGEIADLALHPDEVEMAFEQAPDLAVELGDGKAGNFGWSGLTEHAGWFT